ncbi:MAG: DEAD/DEAH box helicase [Loktanella sp.]|nr:DEAD/DEAH box helicase [Loktanella sp.]
MLPTLAAALETQGYDTLTPVQEAVTDPALDGQDLLVSAQTGSGKTVAFGMSIGATILDDQGLFDGPASPRALIIAPTRELAMQVKRELEWLYAQTGAIMASTVGGMDQRDERRRLERGAHIVVATPGRLKDHILRKSIDLSNIRAIVLDEADEMLDLGFKDDLEFILSSAPDERRTLMFSATVPPLIEKLAKTYQKNAKRIATTSNREQHADISYQAMHVAQHDAENAIINLLRFHDAPNAIVFCNTRAMVTRITTRLSNRGFATVALSGELTQSERSNALQAMRDGRARVCVATDVAARGIDLPKLELVVHAELPTNAETLLHRSGRTGRAGRKGTSVMVVPPKMRRRAENLLKWGKLQAEWTKPPTADEIAIKDQDRLITDSLWTDPLSDEEQAFAKRLLETYDTDLIAAAALRLFTAQNGTGEDLSDYTPPPRDEREDRAPRERKEREPFGPSKWFQLDLGRHQKAEARWLLPMICKAGDITKKEIGAIRIQDEATYVELSEAAVPGFLAAIGPDMRLENQAGLTALDGPPDLGRGARPERPASDNRDSKPRFDKPRADKPRYDKPQDRSTPPPSRADDLPAIAPRDKKATTNREAITPTKDRKPRQDKDARKGKPQDKPYNGKSEGKPYSPKGGDKPFKGKGGDKPYRAKSDGPSPDGPRKPRPAEPGAKPKPRASASDTSKRFTPPGAKQKRGPNATPRRSKPKGT